MINKNKLIFWIYAIMFPIGILNYIAINYEKEQEKQ